MNLRDLRYFVALAETCHFGQAAARSHVSQPTLSGQIRKLEDELGAALFERTTKSVVLTPLGEGLLPHARRALEEAEAFLQLAHAHRDPLTGALRLGAIPTIAPYLIPLILAPLRKRYAALKLVLTEEVTAAVLERLRRRELDAAVIATAATEAEFASRVLFDEPFYLALPRQHPLLGKERLTRRDLEALELLLLSDGHCLSQQVMRVCRLAERRSEGEQSDLRAASLETLLQLVGAGFGATLLPALAARAARLNDAHVVVRPLELPDAKRTVRLVWRKSFPRQAAVDALAEAITTHLPKTLHRPPRRGSSPGAGDEGVPARS